MRNINFFRQSGLLPVIVQEEKTNDVLMLGFMNREVWLKTLETGWVYFWSRSRKKLWMKGEKSGNKLKVQKIFTDCDKDAILIQVKLIGNAACHTGSKSCFQKYETG